MNHQLIDLVKACLNEIGDLDVDNFSLSNDDDIVDYFEMDSMATMLFISNLEDSLSKKIDYESLEKDNYCLSINSIIRAFSIEVLNE